MNYPIKISLMKWQVVITHTICQTEILALLDTLVTNTPSNKILCQQKNGLSFYSHKNLTLLKCWSIKDWSRFFPSPINCVLVCCNKLLFLERCMIIYIH